MDTSLQAKGAYVFGGFRLDTTRRSLVRNGEPISLSSRVFDVLAYLVENPGRVIEKDELLNSVWAGRYVDEANLSQTVFVLRKALKEAGEADSLISTVSGRGHCFTGAVRRDSESALTLDGLSPPAANAPAATRAGLLSGETASSGFTDISVTSRKAGQLWRLVLLTAVLVFSAGAALVFLLPRLGTPEHPLPAFRPPPQSVAVLPFANMSGDSRQQYLSDGFSEELINTLNNVNSLRVADRTSSFYFGGHPAPLMEIARRLNVGAVLEGSMRREGEHLRITVALINAAGGYRFWTRSYDRDFSDILKLQTEIAENVTRSLLATLHMEAAVPLPIGGTNNSAAFDNFLRGWRLMRGRDVPSYRSALAALDEAVRFDPHYARAQVLRAYVLMFLAEDGTATEQNTVQNTLLQALDAANRAVSLAPGWGLPHAAKGDVLSAMLDFAGADRELSRARSLAPDDTNIDRPYAYLESYLGRTAAAEAAAARVVTRFPTDAWAYWDEAQVYYFDRRYADALAASRHANALVAAGPPGSDEATSALAWLARGRADLAAKICAPNKSWEETMCLAIAARRLGNTAEAQARLTALRALLGDRGAHSYAQIYAQWGATEQALAWLGTAYRLRDTGLVQLKVDPLMDPIRARPEFADIERRLDFPQ